jgi:DNA-directed RNA polymerase alpha subunit
VGALVTMKLDELLALRNFGKKSLDEIREQLLSKNLVTEEELATLFVSDAHEQQAG